MINAIDWSRKLEEIFRDNYQRDPGISWQYFGSSTGFLRQVGSELKNSELNLLSPQYPAMTWPALKDDPDMFDSRLRDWYIKSATTPKVDLTLEEKRKSMRHFMRHFMGMRHFMRHLVELILAEILQADRLSPCRAIG